MDRHVIKGRGPNRGKYFCWARMAPGEKATEDGFVWLPEQRKAARWEDPMYNRGTWSTERAHVHNGYFVRLTGPKSFTREMVRELESFIFSHAAGAEETKAAHWIHGCRIDADESTDYCLDCCEAEVERINAEHPKLDEDDDDAVCVDGGWDQNHDSTPFCETCGAQLDGFLTKDGSNEEIDAITTYAKPSFNHPNGWRNLDKAVMNLQFDDPRWNKIARVIEAARKAEQEHAAAQAALAATPGMADARGGFLALLAARSEQKAPNEPEAREAADRGGQSLCEGARVGSALERRSIRHQGPLWPV